jgi:predicted TIM-barrel fold metal-dependent hydrolase
MHLQSSRMVAVLVRLKQIFKQTVEPGDRALLGAADAIAALDAAGIRKAIVLSGGYLIGSPDIRLDDELQQVRQENDWTASQAALFPARLTGFCSVNPLKAYAEAEVARCAAIGLRGLKLHFTNISRVRAVTARANALRLPLLVHMRTRATDYGEKQARAFVERVLPAASDVPVVLGHMAGWGGYDRATDAALGAIVAACSASPAACRQLWCELSTTVLPESAPAAAPGTALRELADAQRDFPDANARLAAHIRALGVGHVLFGSDWPGMTPLEGQAAIGRALPLSPAELRAVFANTLPGMK